MSTPGGLVDKQELIDAQLDTAHLGRVVNSKDASGAPISTSTNRTGGVNKTLDALEAEYQGEISDAVVAFDDQRDQFETTFNAQFTYKRIGNISDYAGQSLPEADKLNSYQYPDDSNAWYAPIQGQSFPITIPADPTVSGSGWVLTASPNIYRGLWPNSGGSANKGDTYQTQIGGTPTGQYFTALQNTTVDPVSDDINWREVVSVDSFSQYTDTVYKASGSNSAVDNMISGSPINTPVGGVASTGSISWKRISNNGDLADFIPLNGVWISDFGVNGSSVSDNIDENAQLQLAIDTAYDKGIKIVKGNALTVGITKIVLKSVHLDMMGGHLYRVAGNFSPSIRPTITAGDFAAPAIFYDNSGLLNCHVTGTGAEEGVSDQGAGVAMYNCNNFVIENVTTDNTNGDGIATRAANGQINNVEIGSFGRNGLSPTSGIIHYKKVEIKGPKLAGANPGFFFDSEINSTTEVSEHYMDGVVSDGFVFVDLRAVSGDDFAIKVQMKNCKLAGSFRTLRFQAANPVVNADIYVDGSNVIELSGASDNSGIEITNVSGVTIGPCTVRNIDATTARLITIKGEVNNLTVQKPDLQGSFSIDCSGDAANQLGDSDLSFTSAPRIYLQGSDNVISANDFQKIDLNLPTTVNNTFANTAKLGSVDIDVSGGARMEDQYFPKNLADTNTRVVPQGDVIFTKSQYQGSGVSQNMDVYINASGVYKVIAKTGSSSGNFAYKEFLVHFNSSSGALTLMQTLHDFSAGGSTISNPVGNVGYISVETTPQFSSNCSLTVIG